MKLILINGADRAGKDTLARYIHKELLESVFLVQVYRISLADPLVRMITDMIDAFTPIDFERGSIFYEQNKDTLFPELFNKSPRGLAIKLAEGFIKETFGKDCFARALLKRSRYFSKQAIVVVPDCRFRAELDCFKKKIGAENIALIHLSSALGSGAIASGEGFLEDPDILTYKIDLAYQETIEAFLKDLKCSQLLFN